MKAFAIPTECFPLAWPTGVPRTQHPRVAPFGRGYNRTSAPAERPWRDVLEVPSEPWTASAPASVLLLFARQQHRELIKRHHPDRGGDPSVAAAINVALAQAEAELGGGS